MDTVTSSTIATTTTASATSCVILRNDNNTPLNERNLPEFAMPSTMLSSSSPPLPSSSPIISERRYVNSVLDNVTSIPRSQKVLHELLLVSSSSSSSFSPLTKWLNLLSEWNHDWDVTCWMKTIDTGNTNKLSLEHIAMSSMLYNSKWLEAVLSIIICSVASQYSEQLPTRQALDDDVSNDDDEDNSRDHSIVMRYVEVAK